MSTDTGIANSVVKDYAREIRDLLLREDYERSDLASVTQDLATRPFGASWKAYFEGLLQGVQEAFDTVLSTPDVKVVALYEYLNDTLQPHIIDLSHRFQNEQAERDQTFAKLKGDILRRMVSQQTFVEDVSITSTGTRITDTMPSLDLSAPDIMAPVHVGSDGQPPASVSPSDLRGVLRSSGSANASRHGAATDENLGQKGARPETPPSASSRSPSRNRRGSQEAPRTRAYQTSSPKRGAGERRPSDGSRASFDDFSMEVSSIKGPPSESGSRRDDRQGQGEMIRLLRAMLASAEESRKREVDDLRADRKREVDKLEAMLAKQAEDHNREVEKLEAGRQREVDTLKVMLAELKEERNREVEKLEAGHQREAEALKVMLAELREDRKREVDRLETIVAELKKDLAESKEERKREVAELKEERKREATTLKERVDELKVTVAELKK